MGASLCEIFGLFSEKKHSGYDLGVGVRGEIKRDMFVCSLGEGDWEKLDYKLRAFFVFHFIIVRISLIIMIYCLITRVMMIVRLVRLDLGKITDVDVRLVEMIHIWWYSL